MAEHAHITPAPRSGTTRRPLASAALAALAAAFVTPAEGEAVTIGRPAADPSPDAELIAACAAFDELERRAIATLTAVLTLEQEAQADRMLDRLRELQEPIVDRICALPCHTLAGASALAVALLRWRGAVFQLDDDPGGPVSDRLQTALFRALIGRA